MIPTPFEWRSSNTSAVSVSATGVVEAVGDGAAEISASANGVTGTVSLSTRPSGVGTATITAPAKPLEVGETFQSVLEARDLDGEAILPVPSMFVWSSADTSAVSVSMSGLVSARKPGNAVIRAEQPGAPQAAASVSINVVAPIPTSLTVTLTSGATPLFVGDTSRAIATARDRRGAVIPGIVPTWLSGDPAIATISSTGVIVAQRAGGPIVIIGDLLPGMQRAAAELTVVQRPVTSITLNPPAATLIQDSLVALTPTLRDSRGTVVTGRAVTWSSSAATVATVSTNGVVTAVGPGIATLTAAADDARGSATLTVLPAVASITVTPGTKMLGTGMNQRFIATLRDASGAVILGRSVEWRVVGPALVVGLDTEGFAFAANPGTVTITASREGRTGSATVISFASIVITSETQDYRVGRAYKFDAAIADSTGALTPIPGGSAGGLGLGTNHVGVMQPLLLNATSMYLAMSPGTTTLSLNQGIRSGRISVTVAANPLDLCASAAGSILLSDEDPPVLLGLVSQPSDPVSIFNPNGVYGSLNSALSINSPGSRYGSQTSPFSARNHLATNPPYLSKGNVTSFRVTLRPNEILGVTPQYLATCPLP